MMKVLQNKLLILIVSHTYLYEKSILSVENQSVENYRWNDTDKRLTAQKLRNGMIFIN